MAKSKTRQRSNSSARKPIAWGGPPPRHSRRWNYAIAGSVVAAVLLGAYVWWDSARTESTFMSLAAEGQAALSGVESIPTDGRRHLDPGETYIYRSNFPTSGPHDTVWVTPGVYGTAQKPTQVVHALEHGNIVIYYDKPAAAGWETLTSWAELYDEQWSGIVMTPAAGLGEAIVLTAWTKLLRLDTIDLAAAAAFIDAYRGRGPEHPVR